MRATAAVAAHPRCAACRCPARCPARARVGVGGVDEGAERWPRRRRRPACAPIARRRCRPSPPTTVTEPVPGPGKSCEEPAERLRSPKKTAERHDEERGDSDQQRADVRTARVATARPAAARRRGPCRGRAGSSVVPLGVGRVGVAGSTSCRAASPVERSESSACWRMMTAAAWSITARPLRASRPAACRPRVASAVVSRSSTSRTGHVGPRDAGACRAGRRHRRVRRPPRPLGAVERQRQPDHDLERARTPPRGRPGAVRSVRGARTAFGRVSVATGTASSAVGVAPGHADPDGADVDAEPDAPAEAARRGRRHAPPSPRTTRLRRRERRRQTGDVRAAALGHVVLAAAATADGGERGLQHGVGRLRPRRARLVGGGDQRHLAVGTAAPSTTAGTSRRARRGPS